MVVVVLVVVVLVVVVLVVVVIVIVPAVAPAAQIFAFVVIFMHGDSAMANGHFIPATTCAAIVAPRAAGVIVAGVEIVMIVACDMKDLSSAIAHNMTCRHDVPF